MYRWIVVVLSAVSVIHGSNTGQSAIGRHFAFAIFPQYTTSGNIGSNYIYITAEKRTSIHIEHGHNGSETYDFSMNPGQYRQPLSTDVRLDSGVEHKGVLVLSDNDISVMVYVHAERTGDVYMVDALTTGHTEFIVTSKEPYIRESTFAIVAATDGTQVSVYQRPGNNYVLVETVNLNTLDTLTYLNGATDFTGYKIVADAPVTVLSGSVCDRVGGIARCDHMYVSVPPVSNLGLNHYIAPVTVRIEAEAYIVRVIATEDDTDVTDLLTGSLVATLQQGEHHDQEPASPSDPAMALACSRPCLVAQYNKGRNQDMSTADPFLMVIPSTEKFITKAMFTTPQYKVDGTYDILVNQLAVVAMVEHSENIFINGVTWDSPWVEFTDGSGLVFTTMDLVDGTYTLECTTPCGFNAWLYGRHPSEPTGLGTSLGYTDETDMWPELDWDFFCELPNAMLTATPLLTAQYRSRLECMRACVSRTACMSLAWRGSSGQCVLYQSETRDTMVVESEYNFYYRYGSRLCDGIFW